MTGGLYEFSKEIKGWDEVSSAGRGGTGKGVVTVESVGKAGRLSRQGLPLHAAGCGSGLLDLWTRSRRISWCSLQNERCLIERRCR